VRVDPTGTKIPTRTMRGQGAPGDIAWDGKDDDGKLAPRDAIYVAQLAVVADQGETAASARLSFGIAFGVPLPQTSEETLRGDFFAGSNRKPKPSKALKTQIAALAKRVGPDDTVVLEVHADGTGDRLPTIALTQRQADLMKDLLAHEGVAIDH